MPGLLSRAVEWLEWWLEPRWRALLTWVGLAVITAVLFESGGAEWLVSATFHVLIDSSPLAMPMALKSVAHVSSLAFLWCWFPPVVLRLGLPKTCVWIAVFEASSCLFSPIASPLACASPSMPASEIDFVLLTGFYGLPGVATGNPRLFWVSMFAGLISAQAFGECTGFVRTHFSPGPPFWNTFPVGFACGQIAYAALMLHAKRLVPNQPPRKSPSASSDSYSP